MSAFDFRAYLDRLDKNNDPLRGPIFFEKPKGLDIPVLAIMRVHAW